ncbi:MAG: MgtC/SapB family protein [Chloroflexota bacterium]
MPVEFGLFVRFGAALAIGFLIGLQREFAHGIEGREIAAGERTFSLLSLGGCVAAMLTDQLGSPLILVTFVAVVGVFTAIGYFTEAWRSERVGLTTEVAIMISLLIGALCYYEHLALAAALGIATTVILSIKLETDRFVRALTRQEVFAALQLAVISVIILPMLPNQGIAEAPFDVLNPFTAWLMVVFISAINFLSYIFVRVVGTRQGIGISGLLGGLVSSTAVTLSFSERSTREPGLARPFAEAIIAAWTVMFVRVLIAVAVINPNLMKEVWLPITLAGAAGLAYAAFLYFKQHGGETGEIELSKPIDLGSAIRFGVLFVVILLVSRTAQIYWGDAGIYLSSLISGLADVDAITLSMSGMSRSGALELKIAGQAIVLAAMANTIAKGSIVLVGGSKELRKAILPGLILILVVGVAAAFL